MKTLLLVISLLSQLALFSPAALAATAAGSGVERGQVPTEVIPNPGLPPALSARLEAELRECCDLTNVQKVFAQTFTSERVFDDALNVFGERFRIELTVLSVNPPRVRTAYADVILYVDNVPDVLTLRADFCR